MDINMCNYSKTAQMLVVARLVRRHSCSILSWCPAFGKASVCWCWWCHWIIWDMGILCGLPSGKHTKNDGKSPFLMGKSTISMTIFNSFLYVYQRVRNSQFTEFGNRPRKSGRPTKSGRYWQYRLGIELRRRHVRNVPKFGGTQKFLHSHRIHVCYIW